MTDLKPFLQKYLDRIEALFEIAEKSQSNAIKVLKSSSLTPAGISKQLNCSRTTLYNHGQLLKRYIEFSATRLAEHNPLLDTDNTIEKRHMLETQVKQMELRDIKNEQLKHEYRILTETVKSKNAEIQRLQTRVAELITELRKYQNLDTRE